jgi:hypothetical protein
MTDATSNLIQTVGVHLVRIDTSSNPPKIVNDFAVSSRDLETYYPAVSVDNNGNLGFIYGYSSATDYPSLAVSRLASSQQQTPDAGLDLAVGTSASNTGGERNRYCDYFGAVQIPQTPLKYGLLGSIIILSIQVTGLHI